MMSENRRIGLVAGLGRRGGGGGGGVLEVGVISMVRDLRIIA